MREMLGEYVERLAVLMKSTRLAANKKEKIAVSEYEMFELGIDISLLLFERLESFNNQPRESPTEQPNRQSFSQSVDELRQRR